MASITGPSGTPLCGGLVDVTIAVCWIPTACAVRRGGGRSARFRDPRLAEVGKRHVGFRRGRPDTAPEIDVRDGTRELSLSQHVFLLAWPSHVLGVEEMRKSATRRREADDASARAACGA